MSDPVSTGAAKVAEEMLQEVQQALEQQTGSGPASVQFQQVVEAQNTGPVNEAGSATDVLRTATRIQVQPPAVGDTLNRGVMAQGIKRVMQDVMQGQNKLSEIVNLALSGRNFSTPEMLALQAGVYRFSAELELTSKIVEKGTATIKQTMNTQV
ncbi:MAG TPA: hypothetical protein RMG48_12410 [Myxococcales bacterium LLY-WYZ-16_1]|jgi:hypothetical protein|nr:hypothetical protein [Myxococcales bacterium LLY-WYZ-16_1]